MVPAMGGRKWYCILMSLKSSFIRTCQCLYGIYRICVYAFYLTGFDYKHVPYVNNVSIGLLTVSRVWFTKYDCLDRGVGTDKIGMHCVVVN